MQRTVSNHQRIRNRRAVPSLRLAPLSPGLLVFLCLISSSKQLRAQQAASRQEQPQTNVEAELQALREEIRALRAEVSGLRHELRSGLSARPTADESATPEVASLAIPDPPATRKQDRRPIAVSTVTQAANLKDGEPALSPSKGPRDQLYNHPQEPPATSGQLGADAQAGSEAQAAELSGTVAMLQSQVAEQAQTKVESNSKMPVKIFGTILSTTFFNSRTVDWADEPSVVQWSRSVVSSTGSFSSSLRQSRIGMVVDGPEIGSMRASGYFAVDFLGGSADFQSGPLFGLPHIVYGYLRLEGARTALEAGQDEMILASRHPTSLVAMSFPELFRSGSLYSRAPQVHVEQELARSKEGSLRVTVGLVAPVGNYPGLDYYGSDLAEAWQRPAVQARLAWRSAESSSGNAGFELGVSGHYGRVRLGLPSANSWAGAVDFDAHHSKVGMDGEFYLGQNLQSFGGGLGQPGKALGGYIEGRLEATSRLQFNTGFGSDHLNSFDIVPVDLNRNTTVFANTIFQFTPEVAASFEYRHLVTRPFAGSLRTNEHLDVGIAYRF